MNSNVPESKIYIYGLTPKLRKMIKQAEKEIDEEASKQIDILYHAAAIVLKRYYGWGQNRILKFVRCSESSYDDCKGDNDLSMVQLCWEECGVDLMREDSDRPWYEVIYLNTEIDSNRPMSGYEWLQMRRNEKKWVSVQIMASILVALHRKEGWGAERCGKFFQYIEDVKHEFSMDPEKIKQASATEAEFELIPEEFWDGKEASDA